MTRTLNFNPLATMNQDPDVRLVAEYIGGLMTDTEADAFEERVATDEAFYQRMGPFLEAWVAPGPVPAEIEIGKRVARRRAAVAKRQARTIRTASLFGSAAIAAEIFILFVKAASGPATILSPTFAKAPTPRVDSSRLAIKPSDPVSPRAPVLAARSGDTARIVVAAASVDSTNAERAISELTNAPHTHAEVTRITVPPVPPRAHPITAPIRIIAQARAPVDTSKMQSIQQYPSGFLTKLWGFLRHPFTHGGK